MQYVYRTLVSIVYLEINFNVGNNLLPIYKPKHMRRKKQPKKAM